MHDIHACLMKKKTILAMALLSSVNYLKRVLLKSQECKAREVIINNEYITYL